jgi:hypothetical protein
MSEHVAWCRFVESATPNLSRIVVCDSDAEGAFKVYRAPDADSAALRGLLRELVAELHRTGTDDSTLLARAAEALAGEPGERSYSAAELREAFVAGRQEGMAWLALVFGLEIGDYPEKMRHFAEAEALRRYGPEKPQEAKP